MNDNTKGTNDGAGTHIKVGNELFPSLISAFLALLLSVSLMPQSANDRARPINNPACVLKAHTENLLCQIGERSVARCYDPAEEFFCYLILESPFLGRCWND